MITFRFVICLTSIFLGCSQSHEPQARQMANPVYPVMAQCSNVEGEVDVIIEVGMDGKVLSVTNGARGSNPDLIAAAKENARQWVWGPFPAKFQFPWYHSIHYVFKLDGKPTAFPHVPPIVKTRLPDEIDIIAVPCYYDFLHLIPVAPDHRAE